MIKSFIFTGLVCALAQMIKDNTNLTNGHITSLFVVIGAILGFFNIYDKIIYLVGGGASVVVMAFGNALYKTGLTDGLLMMLKGGSVSIVVSILTGVVITLIFKVKD